MTDKARELLGRALNFFEEICDSRSVGIEKSINAYLAEPSESPGPLDEEDIIEAFDSSDACGITDNFIAGARFAEKHHGIGGGDE